MMKTTFWKKTAVLATAAALGLSLLGCNAGNQPGSAALPIAPVAQWPHQKAHPCPQWPQ